MDNGPERIWADIDEAEHTRGSMIGRVFATDIGDIEYVRADFHATALAEAKAEIARLRDQIGDWIVRADEANARADRMEALIAQEAEFLDVVQSVKNRYEHALFSISRNTCCGPCQEAALVARAALSLVATDQGEG